MVPTGRFTIPLGTFARPLSLVNTGARIKLRAVAPTNLRLFARNIGSGGVGSVKIRVLTIAYVYHYDHMYDSEQGELIR